MVLLAVYRVVLKGNAVLREKAREVSKVTRNIIKLLDNMRDTMYANKGVGLAAPQIGISKRVIVVDVGEGLYEVINPVIIEAKGESVEAEGCLSVPGFVGDVKRAEYIKVNGIDRAGDKIEIETEGFLARAFQHEVDHLDGILFTDKAKNMRKA